MPVLVRPATVDDADAIARAHVRGWQVAYEGLVPAPFLDALDVAEKAATWRSILAGEVSVPGVPRPVDLVAVVAGDVVGFADVGLFRGDEHDDRDPSVGELWAMYVDPDWWGDGVGDALMESTLSELERLGTARAHLWVLEGNRRARRFYERHGWTSDELTTTFDADGVAVAEVRYSRRISNG